MHTSEKRWGDSSSQVTAVSTNIRNHLQLGEESYQELLELWAYVGSTAQGLADQLFFEIWSTRETIPGTPDTQANAAEVAKAQDLIDAITSVHQLYEAANNIATTQSDRFSELRRMI